MFENHTHSLKKYINYEYNLDSNDQLRDLASRVVKEESKFIPNRAIKAKPCPFSALQPQLAGSPLPPRQKCIVPL